MTREVEHGVVGAWLITVGVGNQGPRIIWAVSRAKCNTGFNGWELRVYRQ
jgi:hypothetical protein